MPPPNENALGVKIEAKIMGKVPSDFDVLS